MSFPPAGSATPHRLTSELRANRTGQRDPDANLVQVEGGEPMPAEEPPPEDPKGSGAPCR
jgi:hypothetical protein